MPRVWTAYVSRFQRARVHVSWLNRGDVFTLEANANAALDSDASIASVVWRVDNPSAVIFGAAAKTARGTTVECTAGAGVAMVKCEITADDGAVFTQLYRIGVYATPYFSGETAPAAGPGSVTA